MKKDIIKLSQDLQEVMDWNLTTVYQLTFTKRGQATNVCAANVGIEIDEVLSEDLNIILLVDEWDVLFNNLSMGLIEPQIWDWKNAKVTNDVEENLYFKIETPDVIIEGRGKMVNSEMEDTGEEFELGFSKYYLSH